jgi:rRNA-processing protein FCF1
VLLDANALLMPIRTRLSLRDEVERHCPGAEIAVPSSVLRELDRLVRRKLPGAGAARALADTFPVVTTALEGDDAVLRVAVDRGAWVVTADRELAGRLKLERITALVPRDRTRLEVGRPRSVRRGAVSQSAGSPPRKRAGLPRGKG